MNITARQESDGRDHQLTRYLLGLLPEQEADHVDELSIADDDIAARLRVLEDDLVDGYVVGALPADTRQQFEAFYLASPLRRRKVEFAERFLRVVDRHASAAGALGRAASLATPSSGDAVTPLAIPVQRRVPARLRDAWLRAAAAMLVVASGVLLVQDVRLRRGASQAGVERAAVEARANGLAQQIESERSANATLSGEVERLRGASRAPVTALLLAPEVRGGEMAGIAVPGNATVVGVDLRLEGQVAAAYSVALQDLEHRKIVWRRQDVRPGRGRASPELSLAIPVSALRPGRYLIELTAPRAGVPAVIASYVFYVERR